MKSIANFKKGRLKAGFMQSSSSWSRAIGSLIRFYRSLRFLQNDVVTFGPPGVVAERLLPGEVGRAQRVYLYACALCLSLLAMMFMVNSVFAVCDPNNPLGCVTNPLPTDKGGGAGLIFLLNNVLRLVFVVAGIYAFVKIVLAGVSFINAGGDTKKIQVAWESIWQSLLGVVIVIASIAIAALLGLLLFGDATAILNPRVYGPIP